MAALARFHDGSGYASTIAAADGGTPPDLLPVSDDVKLQCFKDYREDVDLNLQVRELCASCGCMNHQHRVQLRSMFLSNLPHCMQLTESELERHMSYGEFKHFQSVYHHLPSGAVRGTYYHLHRKHLIETDDDDEKIVTLCHDCYSSLSARNPVRPRYNVGNGFDYGQDRGLIPTLTLAELKACSLVLLNRTIMKINTHAGTLRSAGHSISFAHDGANSIATALPRVDVSDYIKITFIGGKTEWQQLASDRNKFLQRYPEFRLNVDNVMNFLRIKRVLDPAYSSIPIVDDSATRTRLESITQQLIDGAMLIDDPAAVRLEKMTTSSVADPDANKLPRSTPGMLSTDSVTSSNSVQGIESLEETGTVADPSQFMPAKAQDHVNNNNNNSKDSITPTDSAFFEHVFVGPAVGQEAASNSRILRGVQSKLREAVQKNIDNNSVFAHIGSTPLSEFTENSFSIMGSHPDVFLLGQGIPVSRSLKIADYTHMFMQNEHVFTPRPELLFHFFNQLQRHAALREVAFRVDKNDPTSDKLFELLNEPGFDKRLADAIKSPMSNDATKLAREVTSYVRILGSRVPFSQEERQRYVSLLHVLSFHCLNVHATLCAQDNEA